MNFIAGKYKIGLYPKGVASLAEITLVVGILTIILTISIMSFPRAQQSASISTIVNTFLSDFKGQQLKAMSGDTEGGVVAENYGIHFDTYSYTLFKGTWSASDPNNFTVNIPPPIEVTTTFDILGEKEVIFLKGSGEVASWNPAYAITFRDTGTNIQQTIQVEKSGAYTVN